MVCFRAAFDTSKDHPCGVTAIGGYIADPDTWQTIEERWVAELAAFGLDTFHLSEVKNAFRDDWLEVVRPFAQIISDAGVRSLVAHMRDTDWNAVEHPIEYRRICPHREHACLDMLFNILADEIRLGFNNEPVAVVFDRDFGNDKAVVKVHEAWCERNDHPGFNIQPKGAVLWDSVPLQAADLLAGILRQDPFTRGMLDGARPYQHENHPLTRIAGLAMGSGRGAMWSLEIAKLVDQVLRNQKDAL